jgi:AcrR family transcriptional regulator
MADSAPSTTEPTRRDAIIQAATELFARQGFHGVGMRAIADAVGIRSSSLYHHFPSKVDLLRAISLDYTREFVEEQLPELEAGGSPSERLRRVLRNHVLYFDAHRQEEAVGLAHLRELSQLEPQSYEEVQEVRRRYQHAVQAVIQEGIASKDFAVADAQLASLEVLGLINSISDWFHGDGRVTIEQVADEYAAVAVDRILGARPARTATGRARAAAKHAKADPT